MEQQAGHPAVVSPVECEARVRSALARPGASAVIGPLTPSDIVRLRSLPAWVERVGILDGPSARYLWCEPRASAEEPLPSQFVLDVPAGRYFVETLDAVTGDWISRESAEGGPLVAGLTWTGHPIVVVIRQVATSAGRLVADE